jgi:hypothetical protein
MHPANFKCLNQGLLFSKKLRKWSGGLHVLCIFIYVKCYASLTASVVWWAEFLAANLEVRVRFPALPDFLSSSGSGTGSTQPL